MIAKDTCFCLELDTVIIRIKNILHGSAHSEAPLEKSSLGYRYLSPSVRTDYIIHIISIRTERTCNLIGNRPRKSRIAIQHFAGLKNSHDIVLIIGFTLGPKTHTHITDTFSLGFFHVSSIISQNNCVVKRRGCCSKNERKQRESS